MKLQWNSAWQLFRPSFAVYDFYRLYPVGAGSDLMWVPTHAAWWQMVRGTAAQSPELTAQDLLHIADLPSLSPLR